MNQISKKVLHETFSIRYHFHKIIHENTFALTLPCFIRVSRAIAKHARVVLSVFLFKLRCKRHCINLATTTWRKHVTKTAPARRRHSVGGGGGAAAAAHSSSVNRPTNFTVTANRTVVHFGNSCHINTRQVMVSRKIIGHKVSLIPPIPFRFLDGCLSLCTMQWLAGRQRRCW